MKTQLNADRNTMTCTLRPIFNCVAGLGGSGFLDPDISDVSGHPLLASERQVGRTAEQISRHTHESSYPAPQDAPQVSANTVRSALTGASAAYSMHTCMQAPHSNAKGTSCVEICYPGLGSASHTKWCVQS